MKILFLRVFVGLFFLTSSFVWAKPSSLEKSSIKEKESSRVKAPLSAPSIQREEKIKNPFSFEFAERKFHVVFIPEPYLGYGGLGGSSLKTLGTTLTQDVGKFYGFLFGLRALAEFNDLVFVGPDISYFPSVGFSSLGRSPDNNATSIFRLGFVLGARIPQTWAPLPLRVWLGYNFIDNLNENDMGTLQLATGGSTGPFSNLSQKGGFGGYSFKLGLGTKVKDYLSLNMEYVLTFVSTITSKGQEARLPSSTVGIDSLKTSMFVFTVSAPVEVIF